MTLDSLLDSIKTKLLAETWTGGSNVVFGTGSVVISRFMPMQVLRTLRVPIAQIMPGAGRSDPEYGEEPDFLINDVTVRLFVAIPGDATGENVFTGANRADTTKSEGAGLLEIEVPLFSAIGKLNTEDSVTIQYRRMGESGGEYIDDNVYWAYQDYIFEAVCTAS